MLEYQRTIFGYHGCDASVAEKVLSGKGTLSPSENDYDWLGTGVYFGEHGPARALAWAEEIRRRRPKTIPNPTVIGAVLHLGTCFDLADIKYTQSLRDLFPLFRQRLEAAGEPLPVNEGIKRDDRDLVLRFHDCAMLNWAIPILEEEANTKFQTVRCVFVEGESAFEGSGIREKSHVQIAVRDPECIVGYFRPAP
jgi:hypothetical protein